jgi:hypothetical protein
VKTSRIRVVGPGAGELQISPELAQPSSVTETQLEWLGYDLFEGERLFYRLIAKLDKLPEKSFHVTFETV